MSVNKLKASILVKKFSDSERLISDEDIKRYINGGLLSKQEDTIILFDRQECSRTIYKPTCDTTICLRVIEADVLNMFYTGEAKFSYELVDQNKYIINAESLKDYKLIQELLLDRLEDKMGADKVFWNTFLLPEYIELNYIKEIEL